MHTLILSPVLEREPVKEVQDEIDDANISLELDADSPPPTPEPGSAEYKLEEAIGLADAIELDIKAAHSVYVPNPKPATLFGSGKVEEIFDIIEEHEIGLVVVNHILTPIQQRNLEKDWEVKILDRTGLILEIFGERARTREGRMQVELAHLDYQKSRLVRSWTHLERQRGGHGFLGGPGETQIEADRRQIRDRMASIKRDLEKVRQTRELHRKGRRKVPYPIVSLVGYTNAGKSTLFNKLTGAKVMAKDMLFATLDPTMREVHLPSGQRIILSDTVGFISDLPTLLVAAFRATLEEVLEADLILHVRDISSPSTDDQKGDVEKVLDDLQVFDADPKPKLLEVWNKYDLLDTEQKENQLSLAQSAKPDARLVSAYTGYGLDELLDAVDRTLAGSFLEVCIKLAPEDGSLVGWLHENADVTSTDYQDDGFALIKARLTEPAYNRLQSQMSHSCSSQLSFDF